MTCHLLDTNTVSYIFRGQGNAAHHLARCRVGTVFVSAVTEAELRYGLARHPSHRLETAVHEFLLRVEVLPWTSDVAQIYGTLRARLETQGVGIALHDLQIAAHALQQEMVLVSHDAVFTRIRGLKVDDWW